MRYTVEIGGASLEIEVAGGRVLIGGRVQEAQLTGRPGDPLRRLVRGRGSRAFVAARGEQRGEWVLTSGGARLHAQVLDPRETAVRRAGARAGAGPGAGTIKAPMPGLVLRVLVEEGAEVAHGQGLVVVEAMKMENQLKAPRAGVVGKVHCAPGDRVEKGTPLIDMKAD